MSTVQAATVLSKIRSRGYWRVLIRPTRFEERRVAKYSELFPIVEKNSVRLRGWDYPHIDQSGPRLRGKDWVGQEFEQGHNLEVWRLYLSGQFIHYFALAGEWRDQSSFWPADRGWSPGRCLYYLSTVFSLFEIFEFAARLALSPAGDNRMHVGIEIGNLKGRQLVTTDIRVVLTGDYRTEADEWAHSWEGPGTDLIAAPRELATLAAQALFARFGLDVSLETLANLHELLGR